jgi:hypothetical protein
MGFVAALAAFFLPALLAHYRGHSSWALILTACGACMFLWCLFQVCMGRSGFLRSLIVVGSAVGMVISVFISSCTG